MKPDNRPKVDMDAAIDRAVRSIMSAEPRAGLRQRVLSQINEAPRRTWSALRFAVAGGAIAAIALAVAIRVADRPSHTEVAVVRPHPPEAVPPPPERTSPEESRPSVPITPPRPRAPAPSPPVPRGLVVAQSVVTLEDDDARRAALNTAADVPPELEPLLMPALSTIQRLDTSVAAIPPIAMTPVGVSELQVIAPLQGPIR